MTAFVKPLMLTTFAAGSLALAGGQQDVPPTPPTPPVAAVAPAPPLPPGVTIARGGQGGSPAMGGFGGTMFGGPGDVNMFYTRPFGDDPHTRNLAKKLADAKDDEVKDKLRGELKTALAKAFDERQKGQEKQVEELEKQLKRLKDTVSKRKEAKTEIIADRMTALEKEAKGLGW